MTTRVGKVIARSTRETKLQAAIRLRDAILPKLRTSGSFTIVSGLRVLSYKTSPGAPSYFSISLRTPFSGPLPVNDKLLRNWATAGHPLPTRDINLPYGLDVWSKEGKRLNIEWADDGRVHLAGLRRGDWEVIILKWAEGPPAGPGHQYIR